MEFFNTFKEYKKKTGSISKLVELAFDNYIKNYAIPNNTVNPHTILQGKFYTFFYDSEIGKKPYINKRPVIFFTGLKTVDKKFTINGIDIMLLSPLDRLNFIERICKIYGNLIEENINFEKRGFSKMQKHLNVESKILENLMTGINYKHAYTFFSFEKIKGIKEMPKEDWKDLVYLNTRSLIGTTVEEIYKKIN